MAKFFCMKRRILIAAAAIAAASYMWADAPAGYYSKCENKGGSALLESLEQVIGPHTNVGYSALWELYKTSDTYPDGTIWDMYSTKHWQPGKEQCGNYSAVGDCYNREHSMPKSWFNNQAPMVSDAFHIYPTDGKVNGQRGNYPYGECSGGSTLSAPSGIKALGKLGSCTFPGYSGVVFEPDDEYKGDFARSYFYMAACYNALIDDWNSPMLAGNSYPAFTGWAVNLLMKWHRQDPVSDKERNRNEAVYAAQHNRNPFIDNPEMAEYIWGEKKNEHWTYASSDTPQILEPVTGTSLTFGYVRVGEEATLTLAVKGASLTEPVTLACPGVALSASEIAATAANAGASVTLTWRPAVSGDLSATLSLASGTATASVAISGAAYDQVVAKPATEITTEGYTAAWTYVGDEDGDGCYTIVTIPDGATADEGFATKAAAQAGSTRIGGLAPATAYTYVVKTRTMQSAPQAFVTAALQPEIIIFNTHDGVISLEGTPGSAGEPIQVDFLTDNIDEAMAASVAAPFQLSLDKAEWGTQITLLPTDSHFYARVNSENAGQFVSALTIAAGDYLYDDCTLAATVIATSAAIVEDFESDPEGCATYNGCDFAGKIATWHLSDAGIWSGDGGHLSDQAVRMGKKADSSIAATTPIADGIATVSLYASRWTDEEGDCTFVVDYSGDGAEWQSTTHATVSSSEFEKFTFAIGDAQARYVRVRQTAGKRFMIDDIEVVPSTSAAAAPVANKQWTAYSLGGALVIESGAAANACVFGMDGIVRYDGAVAAGATSLSLAPGVYIVSLFDETVTVAIR